MVLTHSIKNLLRQKGTSVLTLKILLEVKVPNYEYNCKDCNLDFTKFVPYSENNSSRCPNCASVNVGQKFSVSVQFKGDGFTKKAKDDEWKS
jgi:putative FmdB family regulatory protein